MPLIEHECVIFELVLPRRPLSLQCRNRANLSAWKDYVRERVQQAWNKPALADQSYYFQIIYICDEDPVDIDNIIKPIQDSLVGIVIDDDVNIVDVSSHRRFVSDDVSSNSYPILLKNSIIDQEAISDLVYIRLCEEKDIGIFV